MVKMIDMLESIKEHLERNYWLHILAVYMVSMFALFNTINVGAGIFILLLLSVYVSVILIGLRKDTSENFVNLLPIAFFIGITPVFFGITMTNNLVLTLLIIMFGNIYYHSHRKRAIDYDSNINPFITDPDSFDESEFKRRKRRNKIDDLLDGDL